MPPPLPPEIQFGSQIFRLAGLDQRPYSLLVHVLRVLGVVTKRKENVQPNYLTDQEQPVLHETWLFSGSQKVNRRTILI